jgi:hypothetical protein
MVLQITDGCRYYLIRIEMQVQLSVVEDQITAV